MFKVVKVVGGVTLLLQMLVLIALFACGGALDQETGLHGECDDQTLERCYEGYAEYCGDDGHWQIKEDCAGQGLKCYYDCVYNNDGYLGHAVCAP